MSLIFCGFIGTAGRPGYFFRRVNFFLGDSEYCREDEAFINSILNDDKIEPSFVTAAKVDAVIDQVKEKAKANGN